MHNKPSYDITDTLARVTGKVNSVDWILLGICVIAVMFSLSCSPGKTFSSPVANSKEGLPAAQKSTITLSAAASTKNVLETIAKKFQTSSGIQVKINTGASSTLANQINAGAPADLFLSANTQWADEVVNAGKASKKERLLTNRLVIVVPESNPAAIESPQDLNKKEVKRIALAGENVPAGIYATQALTKLGFIEEFTTDKKIVRGQDVRTALSYVERGEVEAGIVYSTDVPIASGVKQVYEFDSSLHDEIVYVLVTLKAAESNKSVSYFAAYLRTPEAIDIYARFGFDYLEITDVAGVE